MTERDYSRILTANLEDNQTLDEMIGVIAEMYHATPEQVAEVTAIVNALEDYQDNQDLDQLIDALMHENSEHFISCGSCGEVYPVEDIIDAGTGDWNDDRCPRCADDDMARAYIRSEIKGKMLRAGSDHAGPLHSITAEYLGLDRSVWIATTIDDKGWREDYITDKVLYELVEQLTENLRAAKTDDERDMFLDRYLDVLDAWKDKPTLQISLAAARVNAGLMQKEAAELIGVTELTIINWEAGRYKPSPERYPAIEKAYGLKIDNIKV